jgi:MFS family permease
VDEFHPGALSFNIALAAVAIASTFVAARQWSDRIGRFQRYTVRGLMVTVAIFAVALAVLMAAPPLVLAVVVGCLLYGFGAIVHVSVMILFHRRARPSPSIRVGGSRD